MTNKKINVSFSGGGAFGLTYLGFLKYLEEIRDKIWINKVTGTSIGAIMAAAWSCGYNHKEIADIFKSLNLGKLSKILTGNIFQKIYFLLYSRNKVSKQIIKVLKEKLKWNKIKDKSLYIATTDINKRYIKYFTNKKIEINLAQAVYDSMNIPIIFKDYPTYVFTEKHYFIDGGLLDNNCTGMLNYEDYNILIHPWGEDFLNSNNFSNYKIIKSLFKKYVTILETIFLNGLYVGRDKFDEEIFTGNVAKNILDFSDETINKAIEEGYTKTKEYFEGKK
jgi:hypothetical protein